MFSRGGFDAKAPRRGSAETRGAVDALVALAQGDPDKALVMQYFGELVGAGFAQLETRDNGEVEAHFVSGEIYLLSETTILRLA